MEKVLVGCPTSDHKEYCLKEYVEAVKNLTYPNYDILIIDNSKDDIYLKKMKDLGLEAVKGKYYEGAMQRIVESRNLLRKKFLEGGYDYLLSLEQDVIPPKDVIERLLKHKKDITSGVYFNVFGQKRILMPIAYRWFTKKEKERVLKNKERVRQENPVLYYALERHNFDFEYARQQLLFDEVKEPRLIEIKASGLGCVLISKDVLKKVKFIYNPEGGFDDMPFCKYARDAGFKIYLDTSVKCKHLIEGMDWNKIKKYSIEDQKHYPKVLVGCPTSDHKEYCLKEYIKAVNELSYPNYDILLVDNSEKDDYYRRIKGLGIPVVRTKYTKKARDRIVEGRNLLRKAALDKGYAYFLSLEQDVIPPKDVIERLLKHKKEVVAGVYFLVNPFKYEHKLRSSIWAEYNPKTKMMHRVKNNYILQNPKLMEISASGLGCILIHKDILRKIRFRYDNKTEGFDDVFFAKDIRKNKIKMYVDLSVLCKHLVKNWSWKGIEK